MPEPILSSVTEKFNPFLKKDEAVDTICYCTDALSLLQACCAEKKLVNLTFLIFLRINLTVEVHLSNEQRIHKTKRVRQIFTLSLWWRGESDNIQSQFLKINIFARWYPTKLINLFQIKAKRKQKCIWRHSSQGLLARVTLIHFRKMYMVIFMAHGMRHFSWNDIMVI